MIIDFTVENYRSIKEPVTLSAVAQKRNATRTSQGKRRRYVTPDSEIAPAFPIEGRDFELLPVLALFGANASGKSNVVMALDRLLSFMMFGVREGWDLETLFVPFGLDEESAASPTRFELRVALNGAIYAYSLCANQKRILQEHLNYAPPPPYRNRLLFDRRWDEGSHRYLWENGSSFVGPHTQLEASLQEHEPFLSLLSQRLKVDVIDALSQWLQLRWLGIGLGHEEFDRYFATKMGYDLPQVLLSASEIVRRFDTGISEIEIRKLEEGISRSSDEEYQIFAYHDTKAGRVRWPFEEESTGTQRLFQLVCRMLAAVHSARPLLVDELGSNIHPNIVREIVRLFQDPKTNPKRAQLIFTSHDNTLMRGNLLRRDQIWFTQKRPDGSTDLYSLSDFKPRNDLAIDKAYLDGRFEAVPVLPSEGFLLPTEDIEEPAR